VGGYRILYEIDDEQQLKHCPFPTCSFILFKVR
jgi:hypothetical protein